MSSLTSFDSNLSAYMAENASISTMSTNAGRKKSAKKDVEAIDKKNEDAVNKANKERAKLRKENEKLRKKLEEQARAHEEAEKQREINELKEQLKRSMNPPKKIEKAGCGWCC